MIMYEMVDMRMTRKRSWSVFALATTIAIIAACLFQGASVYAFNTYETDNTGTIYDAFDNYTGNDRPWLENAACELLPPDTSSESGQIGENSSSTYKCSSDDYEWTCSKSVGDVHINKNVYQCDDKSGGVIITDDNGVDWLCDSNATNTGTCMAQDGSNRTCAMGVDCQWDRSYYDLVSGSNSVVTPDSCEKQDLAGWFICSAAELVSDAIDVLVNNLILPMLWWRILL